MLVVHFSTHPQSPQCSEYVGNYMSQDKYFADAAAYRLAEHTLLQKAGESVVIFSDVVTKINKYYKPKDVALMVTSEHFYKYDHKKYKQIKKPIPVASIKSVSLSPHEDTFVIVHMTPPERDLLLNLSVDGNNKVAEFVTMLQQIYTVLHGKALPVEFVQTVTLNLSRDAKKEGTPMNLTYQRDPEPHASGVSRFVALKKPNAAIYYTP
ncbi:hypothetical protein SARC_12384 [Sphaeroforma arctica JP610]|uniref:TH1 domain-containing protein n=1 Tax=Sphaeroforma arctica JP610 TaxID=667725 RepID=A0A0L0FEC6_9EUKA|nr:hypothetical protein SARC_12384 [Sphaeroforma arctica JP610]KNC75085.1 hypothetical protein SARC_12384 [Sphaeroforma arctica JP610]|eukprot:XP_014148987.1 hypothetical protein SARC_12384 [Sphaeroforma arctica JP610]